MDPTCGDPSAERRGPCPPPGDRRDPGPADSAHPHPERQMVTLRYQASWSSSSRPAGRAAGTERNHRPCQENEADESSPARALKSKLPVPPFLLRLPTSRRPARTSELQTSFQGHSSQRPLTLGQHQKPHGAWEPVSEYVAITPARGPPLPPTHGGAAGSVGVLQPRLPSPWLLSASTSCSSVAGRGKWPKDWVSQMLREPGPQCHRLRGSQEQNARPCLLWGPDHPVSTRSTDG